MNSKNIIPIKHKNCTCMKCLKEFKQKELVIIDIPELGYGSAFDGTTTKLILCEQCYEKSNPIIWNKEVTEHFASEYFNDIPDKDYVYTQEYFYENEILTYINNLPIQSQELIWNTFATGWNSDYKMKAQDWIDYELNELDYKNCKKYGLISKEEKDAYVNRFPNCEWVVNQVFEDKSINSKCPYYAYGTKDQGLSDKISPECFQCKYYKKRTNNIATIKEKDFYKYAEDIILKNKKGK